jgi:uncharacterized protein YcfJ
MKTSRLLSVALLAGLLVPAAHASSNRTLNGALLGGIAGAIIGNNSGDGDAWKGAAIGTAAGALFGAASENHQRGNDQDRPLYSHYGDRRDHSFSHYSYRSSYGYSPVYYSPAYSYYRPSYANRGLILGGIAGGIIGNNSRRFHHNTWRGVAIGAGTGWLLGSWADSRHRERTCYDNNLCNPVPNQNPELADNHSSTNSTSAPTQTTPTPQTVIINNYYSTTPMSSANSLFGR